MIKNYTMMNDFVENKANPFKINHILVTILLFCSILLFNNVFGQNIIILPKTGNHIANPAGTTAYIYDNGGGTANYAKNCVGWVYLTPVAGQITTISGSCNSEGGWDLVKIYDGSGTGGTLLYSGSGTTWISYAGTAGQGLTVQFTSDNSNQYSGIGLLVTYGTIGINTVPTSGNNSVACGTTTSLVDNGGRAGNYAANSTGYTVLDAGIASVIKIFGANFAENTWDFVNIYSGVGTGGTLLASYTGYTGTAINYTGTAGQTLTVQFTSDGSNQYGGFDLLVTASGSCTSDNIGWTDASGTNYQAPGTCGNWSATWCAGSGTYSFLTLTQGVNYTVENTGAATCGPALPSAYIQAWYEGGATSCGWGAIPSYGLNTISFNAQITGNHIINVTSSNTVNANACGGGLGHDFTGRSAVLHYKQNTTITNTTSASSICNSGTKALTATLGGAHNNPAIVWSVVPGTGNGTIVGTTFTATASGTVTVRATVGGCSSDVTFTIATGASITSTVADETCPSSNNGSISSVTISGGLSDVRYIRIKQNLTAAQDGWLHPAELKAYEILTGTEVAQGKNVTASGSPYNGSTIASNLTDGNTSSIYHSGAPGETEWVEVDLGAGFNLDYIQIWSGNCCFATRFKDLQLIFKNSAGVEIYSNNIDMSSVSATSFTYNVLDVAWADGATTLNRSGLDNGTYTLNYADASGCSTVAHSKAVGTTNSAPVVVVGGALSSICQGTSSAAMGGSVSGGATGGTWSGGSGIWSSASNPSLATYQAGALESGSITLTLTTSGGSCGTTSDTKSINVDAISTLPTSITVDNNSNNCLGREITLTEVGGALQGSAQYKWGTTSGGTQISTGTSGTTVSHTPTATTNYYVGVTANGACPAQNFATPLTYSLPIGNGNLSGNEAATCYVNGTNPIHFYNTSTGNYIGSINPNGRTGTITMTSYTGAGGVMDACNAPTNPKFKTAYMGRNFTVIPTGAITGAGNLNVYFPFTSAELTALQTASTTATPGNLNDDVASINDLFMTKHSLSGGDNGTPTDNCGDGGINTVIALTGRGATLPFVLSPAVTANYGQVDVSSFSEFYFQGNNNSSPLPVTLTSFTANCDNQTILTWSTASEQNSEKFIVEKSRDGQNWSRVAEQSAAGNSNTVINYSQEDNNSWNGVSYYRLRQTDLNGQETIYGPISTTCSENENNSMTVYPNPNNGAFTVEISSVENHTGAQLLLTDMTGRTIVSQTVNITAGTNQIMISNGNLQMGTYMVTVRGIDSELKPVKVVVNN